MHNFDVTTKMTVAIGQTNWIVRPVAITTWLAVEMLLKVQIILTNTCLWQTANGHLKALRVIIYYYRYGFVACIEA